MVCFNLEVTFGFRLRNRGLWILPGLGVLSVLILGGASGEQLASISNTTNDQNQTNALVNCGGP
jgi:hypothetical protein